MKKWMLIAGVCFLAANLAYGQERVQSKVSVPFEFVVGNTVLPAGTYNVTMPHGSTSLIRLTNTETKASAVASNFDISPPTGKFHNESSNLIVVKDEAGRHVLHQIWIAGQSHGHDLTHEKGLPEPK